jgi:GR25 family glycosyltransferase involved in LPS biosynthesis
VSRFSAVNAKDTDALRRGWEMVGFPNIGYKFDMAIMTQLGVQGILLSHFAIWKEMIDNKIPYMMVFEDDVLFHSKWHELCRLYFEHTPTDYDIVYIGNRNDHEKKAHIEKNVPVHCTHAMLLTYNGVKKLWDMLLNLSIGVYGIDGMIYGATLGMKKSHPFTTYTWNVADFFPCDLRKMNVEWTHRNNGLVFQDEYFGTDLY